MMSVSKPEIRIAKDIQELSQMAAGEFVERAVEAIDRRKLFTVALSGGSTPKRLYSLLSDPMEPFVGQVPWKSCHFFWGDERHVPPDHPQSNYRMARETLLSRISVPPGNVHRVQAENPDADSAASDYDAEIGEFFHLRKGERPRFDFVLLGLGADGHTASLFPGTSVIQEKERLVSAERIEKLHSCRISMTPPVLNHAALVIFLVGGSEKADAVREVISGKFQPDRFPAQLVQPENGNLLWLLDKSAAERLQGPTWVHQCSQREHFSSFLDMES